MAPSFCTTSFFLRCPALAHCLHLLLLIVEFLCSELCASSCFFLLLAINPDNTGKIVARVEFWYQRPCESSSEHFFLSNCTFSFSLRFLSLGPTTHFQNFSQLTTKCEKPFYIQHPKKSHQLENSNFFHFLLLFITFSLISAIFLYSPSLSPPILCIFFLPWFPGCAQAYLKTQPSILNYTTNFFYEAQKSGSSHSRTE